MKGLYACLQLILLTLLSLPNLYAQCISDDCGDIFADWALVSTQTTVCEGATFEVINQTIMPDIEFYVWDWGNGERDTVYEVSNYFYTYIFGEDEACSTGTDFIVFNISLEIYRFCDPDLQSCHTQIAPVAVRFMPRARFTPPAIICENEPFSLSNISCAGIDFFWDFGDGNTSTDPNPDHTYDSTGVYDVTLVVNNQCGADSITQTITVLGQPDAEVATVDGSAASGCVPLEVSFTNQSQNADYYLWTLPEDADYEFLDSTDHASAEPTIRFNEPGIYEVTFTVGNQCNEAESVTTIEVFEPPSVNLFPIPAACDSLLVNFGDYFATDGHIDSFSWQVFGPGDITIPPIAEPSVFFPEPGIYTVSVQGIGLACGTDMDSTQILIQAPEMPILLAPPLDPLCDASAPVEFMATPAGGVWSGIGMDSSGIFSPTVAGAGTHTLQYTYDNEACIVADSLQVTVILADPVMTQDTFSICEVGDPIQLDFSPTGGIWSGTGIVDSLEGIFDPNLSGTGRHALLYELTDSSGCLIQQETQANVAVLPQLQAPDTSAFCVDAGDLDLELELSPSYDLSGGMLVWSGLGIIDSINGIFNSQQAGASGIGLYPVYLLYTGDICSVTDTLYISILDPDTASAGEDRSICIQDGMQQLQASPAGGSWQGPNLLDPNEGTFDPAQVGAGMHTYIYTIAEGTTCEVRDTVMVEIVDLSGLDAGPDVSLCSGDPIYTLSMPSPGGGSWSGPGIINAQNGEVDPALLTADSTYVLYYEISDAQTNCTFRDSVLLQVLTLPEATFSIPDYVCDGESITFSAEAEDACTYLWDFGDGNTSDQPAPTHAFAGVGIYTVSLQVTSCATCVNTYQRDIVVANAPQAGLAIDSPTGCGPLTVQLQNQSTGNDLSYFWDFGNGQTSTAMQPEPVTFGPGVFDTLYTIHLQVENACGMQEVFDSVLVRTVPVARFGTDIDDGCSPLEVTFANTTLGNADFFYWDFANGMTSTDSLPEPMLFAASDSAAQVYNIRLIAENDCGQDTSFREIIVHPNDVVPFIAIDTSKGCAPLSVHFASFATYGADVSWNFGDGTVSGEANVDHTFAEPGIYTVAQYVSNICSQDTAYVDIEVLPSPVAAFTHDAIGCVGENVQFTNSSPDFQSLSWSFGDGETSTAIHPAHSFTTAGTYSITLQISASNFQCPATYTSEITILQRPEVILDQPPAQGCPPLDVCFLPESDAQFYEWDFADGNNSTDKNPCHRFAESGRHEVILRAANGDGCYSDSLRVNVMVYDEPVAAFAEIEPLRCGIPDTLRLQNESIGADSYQWMLGGDYMSNLTSPSMIIQEPGMKEVQLMASNAFQCQDTVSQTFELLPKPTADFLPNSILECTPLEIVFENLSQGADTYQWTFSDGTQTEDIAPALRFDSAGTYDVQLIAGYLDRCFDTLSIANAVELLPSPRAAFDWEIPTSEYLGIVQFINQSEDAYAYEWNFGDGQNSTDEHPLHDYNANGNWDTYLVAFATNGCVDTAYARLENKPIAEIYFPNAFSPESGVGDVRLFKPAGFGIAEWKLSIYSAWGELIYESEELSENQPAAAWDGYYRGKMLPQGAYAYKAAVSFVDGRRKTFVGSVTLLR